MTTAEDLNNIILADIAERLKRSYSRVVYPTAMGNMPVELDKFRIVDENNEIIGYYSINELHKLFGKQFKPIEFKQDKSLMSIRWSFDKADDHKDEKATRTLLFGTNGLADMVAGKQAKDIVKGDLLGNEAGIFDSDEFSRIPDEIIIQGV